MPCGAVPGPASQCAATPRGDYASWAASALQSPRPVADLFLVAVPAPQIVSAAQRVSVVRQVSPLRPLAGQASPLWPASAARQVSPMRPASAARQVSPMRAAAWPGAQPMASPLTLVGPREVNFAAQMVRPLGLASALYGAPGVVHPYASVGPSLVRSMTPTPSPRPAAAMRFVPAPTIVQPMMVSSMWTPRTFETKACTATVDSNSWRDNGNDTPKTSSGTSSVKFSYSPGGAERRWPNDGPPAVRVVSPLLVDGGPTSGGSANSSVRVSSSPTGSQTTQFGNAGLVNVFSKAVFSKAEVAKAVEAIGELLRGRDSLKLRVIKGYRAIAANEAEGLTASDLWRFKETMLEALDMPPQVLLGLEAEAPRFDFDGDGRYRVNEAYKLVKFHLWEWQKRHGGAGPPLAVPQKTPVQAGYTLVKVLGNGSQGEAVLAHDRSGKEVCVKRYPKSAINSCGLAELIEEFETMQLLSCELIAKAMELFQDTQYFYMVNEVYKGGDFMTLVSRARAQGVPMSEHWWRTLFRQCLQALLFMHEQAMMHCDVKEANLMLRTSDFARPEVVVIDFGVSRAMASNSSGVVGTPGYIPPETWDQGKWFPRGDVFSLGVVVVQLSSGKLPPEGPRLRSTPGGIFIEGTMTMEDVAAATRLRVPPFEAMPKELPGLMRLAKWLLQKSLNNRPTPSQALKDQWFVAAAVTPTRSKRSTTQTAPMRHAFHAFATMGITQTFFDRAGAMSDSDDEDEPRQSTPSSATKAVRKLRNGMADVATCVHEDGFREQHLGDGSTVLVCDACGEQPLQAKCIHDDGFREQHLQDGITILVCDTCGEQPLQAKCFHEDGLREQRLQDGRAILVCDTCGEQLSQARRQAKCLHEDGYREQCLQDGRTILVCDTCGEQHLQAPPTPRRTPDARPAPTPRRR